MILVDAQTAMPSGAARRGMAIVTLTANDGLSDSSPDAVLVTGADTRPPEIVAPAEITVLACQADLRDVRIPPPDELDACEGSVEVSGAVVASGGRPLATPVALDEGSAPASVLKPGEHVVRWQAVDAAGLTSTFDQTVRIETCWPMFRRTSSRSGQSPLVGPQSSNVQWVFAANDSDIKSSPAVAAEGTVYFGSDDGRREAEKHEGSCCGGRGSKGMSGRRRRLVSTGLYTSLQVVGCTRWDWNAGSIVCSKDLGGLPAESSPAIGSDGTVYIGSYYNHLYALTPGCVEKWKVQTGGDVDSSPAVGPTGRVYVGSDDNKVYAVEPSGTVAWTFQTNNDIDSTPAVSADGTAVYVGSADDRTKRSTQ